MTITIQADTEEVMKRIGEMLASDAFSGSLVVLSGDLGAGKTTLTKGFAQGLGIERVIKSPTYTLIREYRKGRMPLFHMDMYRIAESGGASELGLEEYLQADGVVMIEWANFIEEELPKERLIVEIERMNLSEREIRLRAIGSSYQEWISKFERKWQEANGTGNNH